MICGQTCDGLYHFAFNLVNFGIPLGSRPIKSAWARHTGVQVPVVSFKIYFFLEKGLRDFSFSISSGPPQIINGRPLSSEAQYVSHHLPRVDCHSHVLYYYIICLFCSLIISGIWSSLHSQKESFHELEVSLFMMLQSKVLVQWVKIQSLNK